MRSTQLLGFVAYVAAQIARPWSPMMDGLLGGVPELRAILESPLSRAFWAADTGLLRVYELPEGWTNCGSEQDIFQFDVMAINPNPPQRNKNATIRVSGTLKEDVTGNVKVDYLLKYGALPIVKDTIDACELVKDFPTLPQCPLKAGYYDVTYEDLIPFQTPMGTYTVHAEGFIPLEDGEKKPVFCVEGVVVIKLFNPSTMRFVTERELE